MALTNLYQLSAMLKLQLPVLFSVAVLRWVFGVWLDLWFSFLLPRHLKRFKPRVDYVRRLFQEARAIFLFAGIVCLVCCAAVDPTVEHPCSPYENVRVLGICSGIAMTVLVTSGRALALGLALATFKAVADTAVCSLFLAVTCALATLKMTDSPWFYVCVGGTCLVYSLQCYHEKHLLNPTGGAVIALIFLVLIAIVKLSVAAWSSLYGSFCSFFRVDSGINSGINSSVKAHEPKDAVPSQARKPKQEGAERAAAKPEDAPKLGVVLGAEVAGDAVGEAGDKVKPEPKQEASQQRLDERDGIEPALDPPRPESKPVQPDPDEE